MDNNYNQPMLRVGDNEIHERLVVWTGLTEMHPLKRAISDCIQHESIRDRLGAILDVIFRGIPRSLTHERNAPPEDCGGISGFYDMVDALVDPDHPNHANATEWADDYVPDTIDELPIVHVDKPILFVSEPMRMRFV